MKQLTMFSYPSLGLAYGLLLTESVIRKLVKACIEDSSKSEVQLAVLFARFVDKHSELIEPAETKYKSTCYEKGELRQLNTKSSWTSWSRALGVVVGHILFCCWSCTSRD